MTKTELLRHAKLGLEEVFNCCGGCLKDWGRKYATGININNFGGKVKEME